MNGQEQRQPTLPFHASARLIPPMFLVPPPPDLFGLYDTLYPGDQMQSQMFDAASNFPAPRRQNTACDACRSRKVKCHQTPGADKVRPNRLSYT